VANFFADAGHSEYAAVGALDVRAAKRRQGFVDTVLSRGGTIVAEFNNLSAPSSIADGRAALRAILPKLGRRTALFCGSDLVAFGVITEARAQGIAVPERLAVCGFGDFELGRESVPAITTVSVDGAAMGRLAAENLLTRFAGGKPPGPILVPFRIIARDTS
jgi:LacI family gluconate utilization system Gnt-I transcriptional repressor